MTVVINGSGTITGISTGGLPDGIVDDGTLANDAVTLAKMASGTDGEVITYDASGNPTTVSVGTSGHVLTSTGAGSAPTMQASAVGGKVLQVLNVVQATEVTTGSSSYSDTGLSLAITPSATTSKILVISSNDCKKIGADTWTNIRCYRDATEIGGTIIGRKINDTDDSGTSQSVYSFTILDSPSTTSAVTYKTQFSSNAGSGTIRINSGSGSSTMCLMEIGA